MIALALTLVPLALASPPPVRLVPPRTQARPDTTAPAALLGRTPAGEPVGLFYYRPSALDPQAIVQGLNPVHGRTTHYVDEADDERHIENLRGFGDLLILVEQLDRAESLLQSIRDFEELATTSSSGHSDETFFYQPRFTSVANLRDALRPLETKSIRANERVSSITTTQEGTALIVRDDPATVRAIRDLLAQVDRPAPQVLLTAWVLQPGDPKTTKLPADLTSELARLLPYEDYDRVAMGLVRASIKPRAQVHIDLEATNDVYRLELRAGAYDVRTGTVSLDEVQFTSNERGLRFVTATSIEPNRYTVLGASGNPSLFVVLHAAPMPTPAAENPAPGER